MADTAQSFKTHRKFVPVFHFVALPILLINVGFAITRAVGGPSVDSLWALAMADWKPDEMTAAVSEYLLLRHKEFDHWKATSNRPPSETSHFTANFLAIRGLQAFGTPEQKKKYLPRCARGEISALA